MNKADIALIGLSTMGQNLALNIADKGYTLACYNRTTTKTDAFIRERATGKTIQGYHSLPELIAQLGQPRIVIAMVKAGHPVDELIEQLSPLLAAGDVLIDAGNSNYTDTIRRANLLEKRGLHFLGVGISGGEAGALHGPAIMCGGSPAAWEVAGPILMKIAAKTQDGTPCCDWLGRDGAGHFVKMAHNAIEYAEMQAIAETYQLLRDVAGLDNPQMSEIFAGWSNGSYLLEITAQILKYPDKNKLALAPENTSFCGKNAFLIDNILDVAKQKGTGRWAVDAALDLELPLNMVADAVFARFLSALQEERQTAAGRARQAKIKMLKDPNKLLTALGQAIFAVQIISFAQGFLLLRGGSEQFHWNFNYARVAQIWREGSIIRSPLLDTIQQAFSANSSLKNLLLAPLINKLLTGSVAGLRKVLIMAIRSGVSCPAFSGALAYYDGYRTAKLPTNLIQAQRDYFGAHTYERIDHPRGEQEHTSWAVEPQNH